MVEDWPRLIATLGFPVAVASYLLIRLEVVLREVRDGLRELVLIHRERRG